MEHCPVSDMDLPHQGANSGVTSNTIVFHCLYFSGGSMVKGWQLSKASAALSISACCFADGAGTSKRGGDATVPSRLKDTRMLMMTLSLGSTPSGCFEQRRHVPGTPRSSRRQARWCRRRRGKPAAERSAESHVLCDRLTMFGCSVAAPSAVKQGCCSDHCFCFRARSSRRVPARPVSLPGAGGRGAGPPGPSGGFGAVGFLASAAGGMRRWRFGKGVFAVGWRWRLGTR